MTKNIKAAILVIGNEILSGRIQDKNVSFIAQRLAKLGIVLSEVRIVPDIKEKISKAILDLKSENNYVFTTGGIGPTHDDITSESIAYSLNLELEINQIAYEMIKQYYESRGDKLNDARTKMAIMPKGAELINNDFTKAPGFKIENIFVLAGIPEIMQNMFGYLEQYLEKGESIESSSLKIFTGESQIADILEKIQNSYQEIDIGSYPFKSDEKHATEIVFKGRDLEKIEKAKAELEEYLSKNNYIFQ